MSVYDDIRPIVGRMFEKKATIADYLVYLRFELTEAMKVLPPDAKNTMPVPGIFLDPLTNQPKIAADDWHASACCLRAYAALFQLERLIAAQGEAATQAEKEPPHAL